MTNKVNSDNFIMETVKQYSQTIAKVAFTYLKSKTECEDVTQEVFMVLMEKRVKFKDEEHLKAWLIRVTINKCKNIVKSGWFKNRSDLPQNYGDEEATVNNEILEAILSLDEKYRIPIHLHFYEGYSIDEIAKFLGESSGAISTRITRAKEKLRSIMGGNGNE